MGADGTLDTTGGLRSLRDESSIASSSSSSIVSGPSAFCSARRADRLGGGGCSLRGTRERYHKLHEVKVCKTSAAGCLHAYLRCCTKHECTYLESREGMAGKAMVEGGGDSGGVQVAVSTVLGASGVLEVGDEGLQLAADMDQSHSA